MKSQQSRLNPPVSERDHIQGNPDAAVTLVEYGDYECPYCGKAYPVVKRLQERAGPAMRFVYRNFPLTELHPHALAAAEVAEAAALQGKFWPMHDALFEHQRALDEGHLLQYARSLDLDSNRLAAALSGNEIKERVREDFLSGARSGVNGTPTFFINGERFDGNWADEEEFAAALAEAARG